MRRFLVLYTKADTGENCYAEGLEHYDGTVYLRGFYEKQHKLFLGLYAVSNHLRDDQDISTFHIHMIDKEEEK